jgi:hypothetical protein
MSFKKSLAKKLEQYLDDEFEKNTPLLLIKDGSILYKKFKISKDISGLWNLYRINGDVVHGFKLKSSAVLAAKYYDKLSYKNVEEIKLLDYDYWTNMVDASFFKHRLTESESNIKKDIFLSRFENSSSKALFYKKEIIKRIRYNF